MEVHVWQLTAARVPATRRDVGVLGEEQRREAAFLGQERDRARADRVMCWEMSDSEVHAPGLPVGLRAPANLAHDEAPAGVHAGTTSLMQLRRVVGGRV